MIIFMGKKYRYILHIFLIFSIIRWDECLFSVDSTSMPECRLHPILKKIVDQNSSYFPLHALIINKTIRREINFDVFIETTDPGKLVKTGLIIRSQAQNIITATLPVSLLQTVVRIPSVKAIEPGLSCQPMLDASIPEIGVNLVWKGFGGEAYQGEGVIIGLYDSGIDWTHEDFIRSDGTSRILWIWDQTDQSGIPPQDFGYGSEYSQSQINDEIDGIPEGVVQGLDRTGHGTHVAGIAAGSGRATGNGLPSEIYRGVAPEADLIIVKGGDNYFFSTSIIEGLTYIFQKANMIDSSIPTVVNLSVGGIQMGPHDGSSLFE